MHVGVRGRYAYCDPEGTPGAEIGVDRQTAGLMGAELVEAWQAAQRAQAAFSDRLRSFDLTNAYAADGALTAPAWLRRHCRMTYAQAAQQLMLARRLDALPEMASALAAGEISYQHAAVIAACARKLGTEAVARQERVLIDCAREVDPFSLRRVTRHLEEMEDPDGSLSFFEQQQERRRLELSRTADGMYTLRGLFDAEGGAVIAGGLESLMGPPAPDDDRPGWQRRADALVEAFRQGAPHVQLTVVAELGTLKGLRGAPGGELGEGSVIPAAILQRLACDCEYQQGRVLGDGIRVELSGLTRVVPPKLRRALELRDGHCRFPGCDRPPRMCDAHHLVEVRLGGRTVLLNLVLLCRRHHGLVHEKGWTLKWGEAGVLLALPP